MVWGFKRRETRRWRGGAGAPAIDWDPVESAGRGNLEEWRGVSERVRRPDRKTDRGPRVWWEKVRVGRKRAKGIWV